MKYIFSIIFSICLVLNIKAQAPQGFNYQGVARNASGVELPNQSIGLQLSVLDGSPSGTVLYTETHVLLTDANGLFTLTIGLGTPTFATFNAINWATGGSKWLKVSLDATGGSSYQLMGTSQLLSVPYALFAGNVANNGGKQTLVLSDDVTDSQAAAIIAAEVGPNTQEIKIVGTTNLTTVNLSMITTAINIEVANNSALTSVNFSGLTRCDGQLNIINCPVLNTLNLSLLTKITTIGLQIENTGLSTINLNNLIKCNGSISINGNSNLTAINLTALTNVFEFYLQSNLLLSSITIPSLSSNTGNLYISNNSQLTSFSFPNLNFSNGIILTNNNLLSNVSLPSLSNTNGISVSGNSSLTSLTFPLLATVGNTNFLVMGNSILSSISFPVLTNISANYASFQNNALTSNPLPALTSFSGANVSFYNNKLSVNAVNLILAKFVSLSPAITSKYIQLNNQNPIAPPSGQGITDKATLISNGNSVDTD